MKDKEVFLMIGVVVGGILWGSITTLIENSGALAIFGLAFSCLVIGGALGAVGHKVVANDD